MSDVSSVPVRAPSFRRLWVVVLMTCLLITMPIALIILLTGQVYRKKADGWQPISNRSRYIYGGALVVWLVAATVRSMLQPGGIQGEWERSADPRLASTTQSQPPENTTAKPAAGQTSEPKQTEPTATPTPAVTPDMRIAVGGQYNDITITADDDMPFIIERIVLNGREGDKQCDFGPIEITEDMTEQQKFVARLRTDLPTKELRRGDSVKFGSTCGQTLEVAVHTNRGVSEYQIVER